MTIEVGVITGDLTLTTTDLGTGEARITIQYTGAEEWYELHGSPAPIPSAGLAALHATTVNAVLAGGNATVPTLP